MKKKTKAILFLAYEKKYIKTNNTKLFKYVEIHYFMEYEFICKLTDDKNKKTCVFRIPKQYIKSGDIKHDTVFDCHCLGMVFECKPQSRGIYKDGNKMLSIAIPKKHYKMFKPLGSRNVKFKLVSKTL